MAKANKSTTCAAELQNFSRRLSRGNVMRTFSFPFALRPGLRLADADLRAPPVAREALCRTPPAALKTAFSVAGVLDNVKNCSFEEFCKRCDMNAHTCPADL